MPFRRRTLLAAAALLIAGVVVLLASSVPQPPGVGLASATQTASLPARAPSGASAGESLPGGAVEH